MATQVHNLPKVPVSPVAVTRLLSRHTRAELVGFVSVAIDLLDVLDGDADDNDTGDGEDEALTGFATRYADKGPGCIASDSRDDQAYIEWHTMRGSQKGGPNIAGNEDAEDDDPREEDDDSGQNTEDEQSSGIYSYGWWPTGPGCIISDPDGNRGTEC